MGSSKAGERLHKKKKVLVLCVSFSRQRQYAKDFELVHTIADLHLAALIDKRKYDVTLYNEMTCGPFDVRRLKDEKYDVAVLSGVIQKDFDRMRQLSYFFRKSGSKVVAGGSICTLFPEFSNEFFDAVCVGGVECIKKFFKDYEKGSVKKTYYSRFDEIGEYAIDYSSLKSRIRPFFHVIEASRGCNMKCDFCTLPAENARHAVYDVDSVMRNLVGSIKSSPFFSVRRVLSTLIFIDNNFGGNLKQLRDLCSRLKKERKVKMWAALVSQNILHNRKIVRMMAESKCRMLFVGIESLDVEFLQKQNKLQNMTDTIKDVDFAQRQGIMVLYGYLFDTRTITMESARQQLATLLKNNCLNFPSFLSFVTPLLGTTFFWKCAKNRELMPNVRLRDLDGGTITLRPSVADIDEISDLAKLLFERTDKVASKGQLIMKTIRNVMRYRYKNPLLWLFILLINTQGNCRLRSNPGINYAAGKDILDPQYKMYPKGISDEDRERYFEPIMVTDGKGELVDWLKKYEPKD